MKKVIKLTESDLARIVRRVIKEQTQQSNQPKSVKLNGQNTLTKNLALAIYNSGSQQYQGYDPNTEHTMYFVVSNPPREDQGAGTINVSLYQVRFGNKGFLFEPAGTVTLLLDKTNNLVEGPFQKGGGTTANPNNYASMFVSTPDGVSVDRIVEYLRAYKTKYPAFATALDNVRQVMNNPTYAKDINPTIKNIVTELS